MKTKKQTPSRTLYCPIRNREVEVIIGCSPYDSWGIGVISCLGKDEQCKKTACRYSMNSVFDPFEGQPELMRLAHEWLSRQQVRSSCRKHQ